MSGFTLQEVVNDFDLASIRVKAGISQVCLVFVNSDSGEATTVVDNNYGDRNNLTVTLPIHLTKCELWHGGEALIAAVLKRVEPFGSWRLSAATILSTIHPKCLGEWGSLQSRSDRPNDDGQRKRHGEPGYEEPAYTPQ